MDALELLNDARHNQMRLANDRFGQAVPQRGIRTSFRTWVQDTDAATCDVAETALAHRLGNAVRRSQARSDPLEPRRIFAEKGGQFVTGASATVVDSKGRAIN